MEKLSSSGLYNMQHIFKTEKPTAEAYLHISIYIYIHIYIGEDWEFIIHIFYWCIPLDHEIYTNIKKI